MRDDASLAAAGHVAPAAADEMIEAYGFLRRGEHRLQMWSKTPDPQPAQRRGGRRAIATSWATDSHSFQKDLLDAALRGKPLRQAVRGGASLDGRAETGGNRHRRRSGHARDLGDPGLFATLGAPAFFRSCTRPLPPRRRGAPRLWTELMGRAC